MSPENQSPSVRSSSDADAIEIQAAASRWVARRETGMTSAEKSEFFRWHAADPRHAAAFARADTARDELDWPLHVGAVDQVVAGLQKRAHRRRARRRVWAAAALATLLVGGALWQIQRPGAVPAQAPAVKLVVLQPQQQTLRDGTVIELKEGAEVSADYSDDRLRVVTLIRGTAHFQVAHDSQRPFIVRAAGVAVRAVGTAFTVELAPRAVTVTVTDGRIAVNQETTRPQTKLALPIDAVAAFTPVLVDAGSAVVVDRSGPAQSSPVVSAIPESELRERLAWRIPRLEFSGTPLAEVIAMINRHNRVQFVLADAALAQLRLSGNLRADKMDALVQLLESDFSITADRRNPAEIVLRQAP